MACVLASPRRYGRVISELIITSAVYNSHQQPTRLLEEPVHTPFSTVKFQPHELPDDTIPTPSAQMCTGDRT